MYQLPEAMVESTADSLQYGYPILDVVCVNGKPVWRIRGFGMVEQWDTEQFAALVDPKQADRGLFDGLDDPMGLADNLSAASHVPPVHTKTWFHTGVYRGRERENGRAHV